MQRFGSHKTQGSTVLETSGGLHVLQKGASQGRQVRQACFSQLQLCSVPTTPSLLPLGPCPIPGMGMPALPLPALCSLLTSSRAAPLTAHQRQSRVKAPPSPKYGCGHTLMALGREARSQPFAEKQAENSPNSRNSLKIEGKSNTAEHCLNIH